MIKPFSFLAPEMLGATERNSRIIDEGTKFIDLTKKIGVLNITGANLAAADAVAWCQVYGPMCYYYIHLVGSPLLSTGSPAYITGIPYGSPSASYLKTVKFRQHLEWVDGNSTEVSTFKPYLDYVAGLPRIFMPNIINHNELFIYGWIFRDS